ncbi:mitochondrial import inner membrane translocase subunit TIM50 [Neltuma alba]|uniref:mitochondrial import inner membrane translocase subunit TIM50 n=1 Tax=Neltuma alba TaxID=207710 RepID=UPI0010A34515|nr:mitochondrial import inner membrane translocase subunit TIM50 [Prosopis alba]XP_028768221.1 mitochondrial import inner membrane translocase subunit TIM50 [Prosopis alba]
MSLRVLGSRAIPFLSKRNGRLLCSVAASSAPKEPLSSASPESDVSSKKQGWSFLKVALASTLTGATAAAGYATYAYSLDEIEEKTKSLRESVKYNAGENATALDKFQQLLYSTAMTVPAKAVELYLDARRLIEEQVQSYTEPYSDKLLPDLLPQEQHVFTLVLDLNETLIHYIWTRDTGWQTFKRPGVDAFLEHLAQFYEIVVYTDEQNMFVDPVLDRLDTKHCIRYRLSRPATKYQDGKHYRDLSKLNRDPRKVLYLSGHALESCLQHENCVPVKPWQQNDKEDTALLDFIPFLEFVARSSPADIRPVLASYQGCDIPTEFIRRSKEHQRRIQGQKRGFWKH